MRTSLRWCLASTAVAALCLWPSSGRAQVTLNFIWHNPDMQSFYLSDFPGIGEGTVDVSQHPDIFTIVLRNVSTETKEVTVRVSFRVGSAVANEIAWIETIPITLNAGEVLSVTNRELGREGSRFATGDSDYDEEATETLQDAILQSGLLPSDTYYFTIEVLNEVGILIPGASALHVLWVSNPTRVDLVGPGSQFGGQLPVIATDTPQFFWSTDAITDVITAGRVSARFQIRVVKVEGASTAEEAMQGFAVWEKIVENQTTEIYPSSVEAMALEVGETYAWQIVRQVETSGGIRGIESDIFWFKMEDPTSGIIGAGIEEEVSQMLNQILELQGVTGELEGYQPTGQVLVDGRPVDLNSLRNLLEQVLSGQLQIATIIIR